MYEGNCEVSQKAMVPGRISASTVSEKLANEKDRLEQRLGEINEAIQMLEKIPDLKNAVNAISKLGHF